MPVKELLARVSSEELTEWMAYEQVAGTLGPERDDVLHGIRTAALVNVQKGKKGRRAKPQDFIPTWDDVKAEQTPDEMLAAVRGINASLGGSDLTQNGGGDGGAAGRAARGRGNADRRPDGRSRGGGR